MKKLLLILLCLPMIGFSQEKNFESFNSELDTYPKLVFESYTDGDETYYLAFFEDGLILYQDPRNLNIVRDTNNTFSSLKEIKELVNDIKKVQNKKETIVKEKYAIQKGKFGSATVKIKDIPQTYTFTKYAVRLFIKSLSKF